MPGKPPSPMVGQMTKDRKLSPVVSTVPPPPKTPVLTPRPPPVQPPPMPGGPPSVQTVPQGDVLREQAFAREDAGAAARGQMPRLGGLAANQPAPPDQVRASPPPSPNQTQPMGGPPVRPGGAPPRDFLRGLPGPARSEFLTWHGQQTTAGQVPRLPTEQDYMAWKASRATIRPPVRPPVIGTPAPPPPVPPVVTGGPTGVNRPVLNPRIADFARRALESQGRAAAAARVR